MAVFLSTYYWDITISFVGSLIHYLLSAEHRLFVAYTHSTQMLLPNQGNNGRQIVIFFSLQTKIMPSIDSFMWLAVVCPVQLLSDIMRKLFNPFLNEIFLKLHLFIAWFNRSLNCCFFGKIEEFFPSSLSVCLCHINVCTCMTRLSYSFLIFSSILDFVVPLSRKKNAVTFDKLA